MGSETEWWAEVQHEYEEWLDYHFSQGYTMEEEEAMEAFFNNLREGEDEREEAESFCY